MLGEFPANTACMLLCSISYDAYLGIYTLLTVSILLHKGDKTVTQCHRNIIGERVSHSSAATLCGNWSTPPFIILYSFPRI